MAVNFSDAVKKYGSTSAAFEALGYTKNENGSWVAPAGGANESAMSSSTSANPATNPNKNDSSAVTAAKQNAYNAALSGDWDAVGRYVNEIAYAGEKNAQGGYDFADANDYMHQLQNEFKYNANDYYRKQYDAVYGEGAWDGGTGTGQPTYNEYSQALVDAYNAQQKQQSTGATANALLNAVQNAGGNLSMAGSGNYADLSQQIKDLYADSLEADLAALKGAYESDSAKLESQSELIRNQFLEAQRQTAAQAALQQQRLGETASAQGLNSGTYGQMALAQNATLQGNLASLAEQQAASLAENDLALAQLLSAYNANVTSAAADNRAKMNEALIEEALRQQNLAAKQQESAREYALSLIASGVMPDPETLAAAGISASEAQMLYRVATAGAPDATSSTPAKKQNPNPVNNGGVSEEDIVKMQNALKISADGKWGNESRKAAYNMWGVSDPAEALAVYNAQNPSGAEWNVPKVTDDTGGVPNNEFATAIQSLSNVIAQANVNGLSDTAKGNIADKAQAMYYELYDRANDAQRQRLNDILAAYGLLEE